MELLEYFVDIVEHRHEYARDWKERTGGKVMGFFCTYVPEEIMYAAGILPVRILGGMEPQDYSESHILGMYCPFCRDCLAEGLKGRYDYLDGVVQTRSCQHMLQAFQSWTIHIPLPYSYFMGMPSLVQADRAPTFMRAETGDFARSLEAWTGKPLRDEDLDGAIETYNTNRRLLRKLYELRKADPPIISGTEVAAVVLSSCISDKAEHSRKLEELLEALPRRSDPPSSATRIMVVGSENQSLELFRLIEDAGANIVVDEMCTGSRYFWNEVVPQEDRLSAIAQRYLDRPPCPLKDVLERKRLEHVLNMARDFNVAGVLFLQQKFCTPHEFDIPALAELLKENAIPTYALELDVTMHEGSIRTRTEAFLEMLQLELV